MVVEHSDTSTKASETDPFGVNPFYFAYLIVKHFSFRISIKVIESDKPQKRKTGEPIKVWLYIIKKL